MMRSVPAQPGTSRTAPMQRNSAQPRSVDPEARNGTATGCHCEEQSDESNPAAATDSGIASVRFATDSLPIVRKRLNVIASDR